MGLGFGLRVFESMAIGFRVLGLGFRECFLAGTRAVISGAQSGSAFPLYVQGPR